MISTYNSYFELSLFVVLEIKNVFQKLGLNEQLGKREFKNPKNNKVKLF